MIQDPTAKLLYEFLQMTDHIAPQKFLEHTAMVAAKDAKEHMQKAQDHSLQLAQNNLASALQQFQKQQHQHEEQIREYQQKIRQQKTAYERLLSDYVTLKQEFDKQRAGMQQLSAQYKLLLDRDGNR